MNINNIEFNDDESEDVMVRIVEEKSGKMVTIMTAGHETLGEDGPVLTQIADDQVIVIYSNEYVMRKMNAAIENNREEFGEMAFTIGFSFLLNQAMEAVREKFFTT
jgi:hypothetical protein